MEQWKERTELLLGEEVLERFKKTTVAVIGLGGVGAYAAEMLTRAGIGNLILVDSDSVNITNKNRQLIALDSTLGKLKTEVLAARLRDINSEVELTIHDTYLEESNIATVLNHPNIDFLVDAIDTLSPKVSLIDFCIKNSIPIVSSMGAGAKRDATKVKIVDISKSYNCPLAYVLRKKLRKIGINRGFKVVFSEELPDTDAIIPAEERNKKSQVGTISYIPAIFGCICAQAVITELEKNYTFDSHC